MKIKHIIEKQDGSVTFQGNVEGPELAFLIEFALNKLVLDGAVPFITKKNVNAASLMPTAEQEQ